MKMTNELYAGVFKRTYGMETLGLRYFNVFGRRHDIYQGMDEAIEWYIKNINGEIA